MILLNQQSLLHLILIFLLCNNFVQSTPPFGSLLPSIQTYDYDLAPMRNQYHLRLSIPESERGKVVELKLPDTREQEIIVMGTIRQMFILEGYQLITEYVADRNGYRARYKLERVPPELRPQFLSPSALKSAAG